MSWCAIGTESVGIARKKQLGGKIELALTSDNPNPYLRAWVRNLAFKPVGMSLNLTMM